MSIDFKSVGKKSLTALRELSVQGGQIVDGFTNLFLSGLNELPEQAQELFAARYAICAACTPENGGLRVGNSCSKHQTAIRNGSCKVRGCGCNLHAATKSYSKHCVLHKWPAVDPYTLEPKPYPEDSARNPCIPVK